MAWNFPSGGLKQSTLALFLANLSVFALALGFNWSLLTIFWGYWLQSVIIGFFAIVKMLNFRDLDSNPRNLQKEKLSTAGFFFFHYGFFHLVYAVFLTVFTFGGTVDASYSDAPFVFAQGTVDFVGILLTGLIFFTNHAYSYFSHPASSSTGTSLGRLMSEPYIRIFPMHMGIIFMPMLPAGLIVGAHNLLILVMAGKTVIDLAMHFILHRNG